MPIRRFNGTSDHLDVSIGAADLKESAYTIAALLRMRNNGAWGGLFIQQTSGGAAQTFSERSEGNHITVSDPSTEIESSLSFKEEDGWCLITITKATGSSKPIFYKIALPSKTVTKVEGGTALGNATVASSITRLGEVQGDFLKGDIAAVACWKKQLSAAEVEALATASSLEGWSSASPAGLWLFNQTAVTEEVKDHTGGGANQSARNGTEVVAEEPPIPYTASGKTVELKGALSSSSTLSGRLTVTRLLRAALSSTSALTGALTRTRRLSGALSSSSPLAGALTRIRALRGALSSTSTLTGKLETSHGAKTVSLAGSLSSSSTLTGKLGRIRALGGSIRSASPLAGALRLNRLLHGVPVSSPSALSGSLSTMHSDAGNRLRVIERPPMRQYLIATSPNGAVVRWGEDEPSAADVLEELTDSDTAPGGHKDLTGSLPRKPGVDYGDMRMGTTLEVFGAGQYKVSEYRLERAPRTSGDYLVMDPAASGFQVLLSDKEEAEGVFIGADLNEWGGPSTSRRKYVNGINRPSQQDPNITPDASGNAAIHLEVQNGWASPTIPICEAWFDGGTCLQVAAVIGDWVNGWPDFSFGLYVGFAENDEGSVAYEGSGDYFIATSGHLSQGPTAPRRYAWIDWQYAATPAGAEGGQYGVDLVNLKVLGGHGLPLRGTWPEVGLLASDIIGFALSRWTPELRYTTGPYGSIQASNFVIPHLVFREPTTVQELVSQALRFELLEWGVWPGQFGPTFFLNERGKREGAKRWRARIRPAKLTETGQQMDQSYNRVVMSWQDPDGTTRTMGPIGSAFAYTDSRCEELDPENPLNEAGVIRTKHLTMNGMGTASGAAEQSRLFLEKCRLLNTSGEATLTGYVEDEHGIEWPYYCVHAGDQIEFLDSSISGYRYIIEAIRSRKTRSVSIKLDSPPDSYEAILAELQVRETVAGIGS